MTLHRSEKAKDELASRNRVLTLCERGALFLADGQRTREEVQALMEDDGNILQKLIEDGYLLQGEARAGAAARRSTPPEAELLRGADNFEGKRSLAATRMFLFDICERMFVRKMPALAEHYREQLRQARTRESMVALARDITLDVEELAGPERADGLRERIAMLLPTEQ